jgi:N-acetyl-alpha-D-glucosaminyl L-malate synthase BshA
MLRIGIVCYPTFGGSGVVATELGIALAKQGNQVHFISYEQPVRLNIFTENIYYHEVAFTSYPLFKYPPYEIALTSKIVDIVKAHNLTVLHVHYAIPHAAAAVMAKEILKTEGIDIRIVTTLHGTDITLVGKDGSYEPVVSYCINRSDVVTTVSDSLKEDTLKYFRVEKQIKVVPNFIDFSRFNKLPKDHFKKAIAPENEKIIVHTSNFRKVKRVWDVVYVFEKILKSVPSRLLMIGDGPERLNMENLCRELGVSDKVTFLGKQEAIEEILSVADLFIIPSETESFGLAALVAMACDVPVISTNKGGLPEVNINGFTGYTSDVGDIHKMAKDALIILRDENLDTFKKQAKEHALKFSMDEILPLYVALYS